MKVPKKIKKYANKAYTTAQTIDERKIVKKVATYGLKQIFGGTYLDVLSLLYDPTKKKALKYAGNYAYDGFFRSKFAREKINTIPMSITAVVFRMIFNFLLFSRLKTEIYWLDFGISIILTVIVTLLSPFFYTSIKAHEPDFMRFTDNFIENFLGDNGWDYLENFKNKILISLGIAMMLILQFFDRVAIQKMILHTLIAGGISYKLQLVIDSFSPYHDIRYMSIESAPVPCYIINMMLPLKIAKKSNTKNIVFRELKPLKIVIVKIEY